MNTYPLSLKEDGVSLGCSKRSKLTKLTNCGNASYDYFVPSSVLLMKSAVASCSSFNAGVVT
jgi:hypothetical protein